MAALGENAGGSFKASSLAEWFHDSPHKDFHFEDTTTIFTPSDKSYREALLLLAIFISSFGVLLLILSLLYHVCCFCIWKKVTGLPPDIYRSRKACLQNLIVIGGLICCAFVVLGFIFNGYTSDGVDQFRNAVSEIQQNINIAATQGGHVKSDLINVNGWLQSLANKSQLTEAKKALLYSFEMLSSLKYINELLPQHMVDDSNSISDEVHRYDNYRWLATVSLFTWCLFLFFFSIWVRCQTNGCVMSGLTVLSCTSIVLTWAALGADFGVATGAGDFCVNPKVPIRELTQNNTISAVVTYFMDCDQFNPLSKNLDSFNSNLSGSTSAIKEIQQNYPEYKDLTSKILTGLDDIGNKFPIYENDFSCQKINEEYMDAMDGLCRKALIGLSMVMLSLLIIGLFSGFLTCCVCPLWKYRKSYDYVYPNLNDAEVGYTVDGILLWPDGMREQNHSAEQRLGQQTTADHSERSPLIGHQHNLNYLERNSTVIDNRRNAEPSTSDTYGAIGGQNSSHGFKNIQDQYLSQSF